MTTIEDRMAEVRIVLLDVDGVLTDGRLTYGPSGDAERRFHVRDGAALKLAQASGLLVGLITGRSTEATARWAADLGLDEIHQGQRLKVRAWEDVLARRGLEPRHAAYMGDDVLDLPVLELAGLAAAPADAAPEVLEAVHWTASRPGGHACVRELLETILRSRGEWEPTVRREYWPSPGG